MQDVPSLSPLLSYDPWPLFLAGGLLGGIGLLYGIIFWMTRRKPQKVLSALPPAPAIQIDHTNLKQRYLAEIDRVASAYAAHELKARLLHQQLSRIVRSFVSEAEDVPVTTMTLTEIAKTRHGKLAEVIQSYYKPEFAAVESGNAEQAIDAARKVVSEWS